MKFVTWYLQECKYRYKRSVAVIVVFGPLITLIAIAEEGPIDSLAKWLLVVAAVLMPVSFGKWFWPWLWMEEKASPLTAEQLLQQRIVEVADSVDALPDGTSLNEILGSMDEKQLRKVLHLLHQVRPGNRHLRDVLMRIHDV